MNQPHGRSLYAYIDGHEDHSVVLVNCGATLGAPLLDYIGEQRWQKKFRIEFKKFAATMSKSPKASQDTRAFWRSLSHDPWPLDLQPDVRSLLRCLYDDRLKGGVPGLEAFSKGGEKKKALKDARELLNRAHHGPLSQDDTEGVPSALRALQDVAAALRDAKTELMDLKRVAKVIEQRAKWKARHQGAVRAPLEDITCAAVHWVEPKDTIPGSWSVVLLPPDSDTAEGHYDQTTEEVYARLTACEGPVRVGLAFCFSCPEDELNASSSWAGDPRKLWEWCRRDATQFQNDRAPLDEDAILKASRSFAILTPKNRDEMRQPDKEQDRPFFRMTELASCEDLGVPPASFFDLGGPGSVGALAIKGMPLLEMFSREGATMWPLDTPAITGNAAHITCVEIFPGALWTSIFPSLLPQSKKSRMRRRDFLFKAQRPEGHLRLLVKDVDLFVDDERLFDAALTAWALRNYGDNLDQLTPGPGSPELLEGKFWLPTTVPLPD